ncbi:CPBP family intramembrane metalloprotease [Sporolactobacillus shoreicorticis]|uniref:Type II CAAX prenyl endopeptidase Rce1 family protein n=1 Tax=Sporolactobacillus shoreicorticis TaxID=1923877 RepID=A0ABW5S5C1_9BACL|nr:CPBP family intramembrane glutamic endopeptidase [Sporolactobacillus shoreicorticis]MCO7124334.1 CPBP family intramembrane metalloprotease [Sporolactobacillus shoreicorticis]
MLLLLSTLVTTITQTILLFLFVILVWIFTGRKQGAELPDWLGLKKFHWSKKIGNFFIILLILYTMLKSFSQVLIPDHAETRLLFYHAGAIALIPACIAAFFQSALLEEVAFRSIITKIFSRRYGFRSGNLIQAILFGVYYFIFMIGTLGIGLALFIAIIAAYFGYAFGNINEKKADGSVFPSWLLNGTASFVSYLLIMF